MRKQNAGITLIALVITIIVLLILAGISIATLTGENGILTKANNAAKESDIADTKEQIKIELMGSFDDKGNSYTNQDVINAVKKITGKEVVENTEKVQSLKGNEVDISDLWLSGNIVRFSIEGVFYEVEKGTTWNEYLNQNNPDGYYGWLWYGKGEVMYFVSDLIESVTVKYLRDKNDQQVYKNDLIKSREL